MLRTALMSAHVAAASPALSFGRAVSLGLLACAGASAGSACDSGASARGGDRDAAGTADATFCDAPGDGTEPDASGPLACDAGIASHPSARTSNAMVYDEKTQAITLTGGFRGPTVYDDTWRLAGCRWQKLCSAVHPAARVDQGFAYVPGAGAAVLFGGADVSLLFGGDAGLKVFGDTWLWNGTDWTELSPPRSPPARLSAAMAYDGARRNVVLFGGWTVLVTLGDTWTWDGSTWTEHTPAASPSSRLVHTLAFDEARGQVVLFGGWDGVTTIYDDTWTWDGVTWTAQTPPVKPPPRFDHGVGYDRARKQVVVFGGQTAIGVGAKNDTWVWDGASWTQLEPAHRPAPRVVHGLVWDEGRQALVLFGGWDGTHFFDDTWEWTGSDWRQL